MLLHFSNRRRLSIQSSSMRIKFQLLSMISVVADVEVSLATASSASAAAESSSSTYASSFSRQFLFYFTWTIPIYIGWNSIILVICFPLFRHEDYVFLSRLFCLYCLDDFLSLVSSILWIVVTFFSRWFSELSWLVFCLFWTINYTVLVGWFKIPTVF